ncbi:MAG: HlyD family secretion protein [Burkholderiaceae bacterium]|nr:HlyD family secretion protein [Burkholderiaceae bacterium]
MSIQWKNAAATALALGAALAALLSWAPWTEEAVGDGFVSGNGRIEATEISIATKTGGRVAEIRVNEGDFVQAGQVLVRMELDSLRAQRDEAVARLQQAQEAVANARAAVALRESDHASALAVVAQRESELEAAQRRLPRSEKLAQDGFYSSQVLDDDRARVRTLEAAQISFVASSAQFTPKTVETESERQKLMFRVRAQIPRELLLKYQTQVKTGLPGVAWVKLDAQAPWPERLNRQLVQ